MGNSTREMAYERHAFGYPVAKKPKLSFSRPTVPSSSIVSHQNDDLWGEDLPELELDACFEIATQACSQLQSQTSKENQAASSTPRISTVTTSTARQHSTGNLTTVQVSQKLAPSDIFKVPGCGNIAKDMPTAKFRPKQWSHVNNRSILSVSVARPTSASQDQNFASHSGMDNDLSKKTIPATLFLEPIQEEGKYNEQMQKLQIENAKLKQQFCTKDGEISILRTQLKQSDAKASCQLHTKIQEHEAKIRAIEKELEKTKTIAELQKLEAWKAKDKLLTVNASQHAPSVPTIPNKTVHCAQLEGFGKVTPSISYGELLLDNLTPHLFFKSFPEINLVELKTTFSLLDDTADRKRTVFNPIHYTVEACWESTLQLGLESSLDTTTAQCQIKKIFNECYKILCCLLITLRERAEKETDYNLDSRDLQNARAKVDALDDPNLLSHDTWYKNERGVESRRVLGLLAEISLHSKYMADLINGTSHKGSQSAMMHHSKKRNNSEGKSNSSFACVQNVFGHSLQSSDVEKRRQLEKTHLAPSINSGPSTTHPLADFQGGVQTASGSDVVPQLRPSINSADMGLRRQTPVLHQNHCINTQDLKEEQLSKIEAIMCSYKTQDFGFLKLIRDITLIIASQNNSFEYSGFLTAVIVLLTNIQRNSSLIKHNNGYLSTFCAIVETIIRSRPRMETTVALAELIDALSYNTEFMNALCHSSQANTNGDGVEKIDQNQNLCPLSMLCWLLERETTSSRTRTRICQAIVNWMTVGVKCRPFNGPKWTQCQIQSLPDTCFCRIRMIEAMVILIYRTFKDFEVVLANTSRKESVRNILVRGIMLLYYQIESDPDFGHHMDDVEGYYQLLLMGLKNTENNLRLDKHEASALGELLSMEETITPPKFELTTNLETHMDSIISKIELGWSEV